ncbi:MAG: hypothetical protein AB8F65_14015 [Woeseiaceae bacterium]
MHFIHALLLKAHIGIGAIALIAFWLPVATRKGSSLHKKSGRIYVWCMSIVAASAIAMSLMVLMDPIGVRVPARNLDMERAALIASNNRMFALFLLMLGMLTAAGLRHGLLALRVKQQPDALRSKGHVVLLASLGVMGILVGYTGIVYSQVLLMVFAVIAISGSVNTLREAFKRNMTRNDRIKAHFGGLIGTGIGAYTAFFAFGGSRLLADILRGQWQVIPWVLPAIIGTIAIRRVEKNYQNKATS